MLKILIVSDATGGTAERLAQSAVVQFEGAAEPYASLAQVVKENRYAEGLCSKYGWERIDVTGKAVEEVAREIITVLTAKPPAEPTH